MILKHSLKSIISIIIIIFILLWINQFFAIKSIYQSEKLQWQKLIDSVVAHSIDSYVRPYDMLYSYDPLHSNTVSFNPDNQTITILRNQVRYDFKTDSTEMQEELMLRAMYELRINNLAPLKQLDSILHTNAAFCSKHINFVIHKSDSLNNVIDRFPSLQVNISNMISSKSYILGFIDGESLQIYYNFPFLIFLKDNWNSLLTICMITLLFILLMVGIVYLFSFMRKLSKYQEDMMYKIIHDWKTPLNSVKAMTELLQRKSISPEDKKGQDKIQFIFQEIEHLQNGSQEVMKTLFASTSIQLDKIEFDLKKGLLSLIQEEQAANPNKVIHFDLQYLLPSSVVYASQFHLICAIRNLLDNAIKYGKESPSISIKCFQEDKSLVIKVIDDGPGIPKEKQKFIFDKYYRITEKDAGKSNVGYGLGLHYVYSVIKLHKGIIKINSTPENGCIFTIKIRKWTKK